MHHIAAVVLPQDLEAVGQELVLRGLASNLARARLDDRLLHDEDDRAAHQSQVRLDLVLDGGPAAYERRVALLLDAFHFGDHHQVIRHRTRRPRGKGRGATLHRSDIHRSKVRSSGAAMEAAHCPHVYAAEAALRRFKKAHSANCRVGSLHDDLDILRKVV